MKKRMLVVLLVMMIVVVGGTLAQAKTSLTFAHETTKPHPVYLWGEKFQQYVAELSKGEMEIIHYGNAELGNAVETAQQCKMGTVDMANLGTPIVQYLPEYGVFDLPYIFKSREHAYAVAWGDLGKELSDRLLEKTGMFALSYYENGFRQITNNVRPINVPEDLKGIKIRTPNSNIRVKAFKAFGAAPTPMPFTEVYGALQRGTMDGQENPVANIAAHKLNEVQKYLSISNHVYGFQICLMNENSWNNLTAEEQEILKEAAQKASEWEVEYCASSEAEIINQLDEAGMEVNYANIDAFQAVALDKIWSQYEDKWGDLIDKIIQVGKEL